MRNWRKYIAWVFVLILVGFAFNTAEAQNGGEIHFPGNVVVTGDFLKFYRSVPDAQLLLGNAISNVQVENGTPVQYFERARLELKATEKGPQVQLAPLGYFQFDDTKALTSLDIPPSSCRIFPKYGHRVCYSFLQFYDEHSGAIYFGSPVSEMILENGQIVQYFEYARFEYRPNKPAEMKVGLTNIGRLAMKKKYGSAPMPPPSSGLGPGELLEAPAIHARAFVGRALVAPGSPNTLYVVVQFPDFKGVANAKLNITVLVGNKAISLPVAVTDADGIAKIELDGFNLAPQLPVQLQVVVNYMEQTVKTSTWYRIWY